MRMKRTGVLGILALGLLAACVPNVSEPEVRVERARLSSFGLTGGVVDIHLSVYNPNRFGLRASGLTYDLELEDPGGEGWFDFTEGRIDRDLEVASGDTLQVVIPVEFQYGGLGRAIRGLLERGAFDYRVSGVVALEGPVRRNFRYRQEGTVTPDGIR